MTNEQPPVYIGGGKLLDVPAIVNRRTTATRISERRM